MASNSVSPKLPEGDWCYYICPSQDPNEHNGYVPSIVVRDEAGFRPLNGNGSCATPWVWGLTLKEAEAQARKRNLRIGISPEEANLIVLSSMLRV